MYVCVRSRANPMLVNCCSTVQIYILLSPRHVP
uniref:Uncharacterized protein n=1 Tax=Arundo donax TaxID=35708 RepID=A0A0A9CGJ9_ARUDO